jgi:signal transduction histidine kinase
MNGDDVQRVVGRFPAKTGSNTQKQDGQALAAENAKLARANAELEQALAKRNRELLESTEQLESFAYSIAHDMRAPLRTMHQYAEIVARDFTAQVPPEALAYLRKIMGAAEKLDSHIRDVLVYTRVSQGRLEMQPINLERILSEVLLMAPHLNSPAVELNARLPLHTVIGDSTALTQALSNLLSNAVKFVPSDRKPKITIWTEAMGGNVRISIKDNGIGIAATNQGRIFKLFERLQPEGDFEGSGIGLTIVRRAVERMNGHLGVESKEGEGSTFWIELKKGELP